LITRWFIITEPTLTPLDEIVVDFLLSKKRETSEIDFKLTLDISKNSDFAKIAKDIFAMSNYGGGYLVIGFKEKETGGYEPVGLPQDFHIDSASLQEKFDAYSNAPLALDYKEIEKEIKEDTKKFAILYIPPSPTILKPIKFATYFDVKTKREKRLFSKDEILIRRGTKNDHATLQEIKFIEKRCLETEYRISLLSGEPDIIGEELFGNFFKVKKIPEFIYEADIAKNLRFSFNETRSKPYFRPWNSGKLYSFCNLSEEPFGKYLITDSLKKSKTTSYLESEAKRSFLIKLLNNEIQYSALDMKLKYAGRNKNIFYFTTTENERYIDWEGPYRKSKKRVAYKTQAPDTGEEIFIHDGASIRFQFINDDLHLVILPTVVTTYDGFNVTKGPDEGPTKTHYSYRKFNDSFLKLILFWIYQFKEIGNKTILVNNRIEVSPEPIAIDINIGIRQDRPAEEFHDREDDLYNALNLKYKENRFFANNITEPDLIFGHQKEEKDPKIGLQKFGPYYTTHGLDY
jgi:Putative DNA-binding domain